jgi:hypothetical protein
MDSYYLRHIVRSQYIALDPPSDFRSVPQLAVFNRQPADCSAQVAVLDLQ